MYIISRYTIEQATEDGFLFNITETNKEWEKGIFSHVTIGLLNSGYIKEDEINISNFLDLLNQANNIVRVKSNNFKDFDTFFSGKIELPNGSKQDIFIAQNELSKFTIMLPQDY